MKKPKPEAGSNAVTKRTLNWETFYRENPHIPRRPEHMKSAATPKATPAEAEPEAPPVVTPPAPPTVTEVPVVEVLPPVAEEPEPLVIDTPVVEELPPITEEAVPPTTAVEVPVVLAPVREPPPPEAKPVPKRAPARRAKPKPALQKPKPVDAQEEATALETLLGQVGLSETMQKTFGRVVRYHLARKGMTQSKASDQMGFKNRGQFGNLLDARGSRWTPERLAKLKEVLETMAKVLLRDLRRTVAGD